MPPLSLDLEPELKRFVVTPHVEAPRSDVLRALLEAAAERPSIRSWDCVADLRNPMSGEFEFDLRDLVPIFDIEGDRPPVTVIVSTASRTRPWAMVLNHQFRSRRFHVAGTLREAVEHLDHGGGRYDRLVA